MSAPQDTPMSETHDPWVNVRALRPNPYSHENYYVASEVDAARATEAALNQQALERLTRQAQDISVTLGEAGCRAMPIVDGVRWLVDHNLQLRASLAAVEAERDAERQRWMDARAREIEHSIRADRAEAERDRLKAAFLELHATVKGECPSLLDPDRGGSDVLWALCAAALTPHQGQSTDGETR